MVHTTDNKQWIIDRQESIMQYYLGREITPKLIRSPFREDKHPTCGFYYGKTGRLYLHDFATDEHMDCIEIVKRKYKLSFPKAIDFILADADKFETEEKQDLNETKVLEYIPGNQDFTYFLKLGIKSSTLKKYGVYTARAIYIDEQLFWRATEKNPIFIYQFPSGTFKAYRPMSKDRENKWKSNCSAQDIQGFHQLAPTGKILIITSSMKDVMVLHEMGFPAIAFQSEHIASRGEKAKAAKEIIEQLKERYTHVLTLMDNDTTGKASALACKKAFDIDHIHLPDNLPKDISDHVASYGIRKSKKLMKKLISRKLTKHETTFEEYLSTIPGSGMSLDDHGKFSIPRDLLDLPGIEISY